VLVQVRVVRDQRPGQGKSTNVCFCFVSTDQSIESFLRKKRAFGKFVSGQCTGVKGRGGHHDTLQVHGAGTGEQLLQNPKLCEVGAV
jgi:hypothetical protein